MVVSPTSHFAGAQACVPGRIITSAHVGAEELWICAENGEETLWRNFLLIQWWLLGITGSSPKFPTFEDEQFCQLHRLPAPCSLTSWMFIKMLGPSLTMTCIRLLFVMAEGTTYKHYFVALIHFLREITISKWGISTTTHRYNNQLP